MTKQTDQFSDSTGQAGAIDVTPAMIEAGVAELVRTLGGQTEGENRFVDFPEMAKSLFRAMWQQQQR